MAFSVIIPAFNEEMYIAETLEHIKKAEQYLLQKGGPAVEILVVDNASTDSTASIARASGAQVITEAIHNVARVRNAGARRALQGILVFIDADTLVPVDTLWRISQEMADSSCLGGAVDVEHRPTGWLLKAYFQLWRVIGMLVGMAQGATQFCRSDIHVALGGYDETLYMGEDVDFYWRLNKLAKLRGRRTCFIKAIRVIPSTRRFDQWPLWKTLLWTNPLFILLFRRRKEAWKGWYQTVPR